VVSELSEFGKTIVTRRFAPAVAVFAIGCGAGAGTDTSDAGPLAGVPVYAPAFHDFHSWYSVPGVGPKDAGNGITASGDAGSAVHTMGPLVSYINNRPPSGSSSFPLGTIIVKEVNAGDLTSRQIFAMVKRGAGFNAGGAVDWEWFELRNIDADDVLIVWRGLGPPSGETYGGNPATCNDCHEGAKANDYVWTTGFQLSAF
jgi:hypothetical protein